MGKFVRAAIGVAIIAASVFVPGANFLVPLGLSLVSSALLSPRNKQQARQASQTAITFGEVPRVAIFGETATAGAHVE